MSKYINRLVATSILEAHQFFPVIVVTGPRQSGKSTLCRHLFPDYIYVNLEDISLRTEAMRNPVGFLDSLGEKVIIDEVQNVPEILSMIQVRVDEYKNRKYILTGSSNFSLLRTKSQSLAGRAAIFTLLPFSLIETKDIVADEGTNRIIVNGLYPRVIADHAPTELYYRSYYNTYVERDLRDLLKIKNLMAFDTFIRLLASRIGSEFNASAIAREAGVSSVTVKEWMSILMTSYIAFPLMPYYRNISKQLTKMPKIYFYDTGLACFLLGITNDEILKNHQMRGALFENLAICELLKRSYNEGREPRLFFYRENSGLEVDVVSEENGGLHLYEIKAGATLRSNYLDNMKKVREILPNVTGHTVIYDSVGHPPISLNIRDI
ncbi:MAG: ATP-binding protein [Bacteroidales bacterium]|nr:ATP-binding protein [Bacteroidales bacterium]